MKKEITCTTCPNGCEIQVKGTETEIVSLIGAQCRRGEVYAKNEFLHPVRVLTTTVRTAGEPLPVRSSKPIPKELLLACMEVIRMQYAVPPVCLHQVIIPNILGTGADIIATREMLTVQQS